MARKKTEKQKEEVSVENEVTLDVEEETTETPATQEAVEETEAEVEKREKKSRKKAMRIRKSKKESEHPIEIAIKLAVESGKVEFGYKTTLKNAIEGKAKAFVLASRAPAAFLENIEQHAKISKIPLVYFEGTPLELGVACGKPFNVVGLSIYEEGSSSIMELVKKSK